MGELLASGSFQLGGELRRGSWSVVLLSTFLAGEDAGGLGPARLQGLRQALAAHAGQHLLVAMHHHPLPMGSTWLDGVALRDATAFWSVIDAHEEVRGVICGHVHQAADRTRNRVRFLSTPSTCAQFLPGSEFFALDDRPPGMRWLELYDDGRIETEVAWVTAVARA
jgi:Icc protein